MTFSFDLYEEDNKIGRVEVVDNILVKNETYTSELLSQPCARIRDFETMFRWMQSRLMCPSRWTKEILNHYGLESYNAYKLLKITRGIDIDDFFWFKFDDDIKDLKWKDFNPRRFQ